MSIRYKRKKSARKTPGGLDIFTWLFLQNNCQVFEVNVHSAFVWVKRFAENNYFKPAPIDDSVMIELDEMWHFLRAKKRRVWIWKAYCRTTKQLIDLDCGARDAETFRKMYEQLKKQNIKIFFSDRYSVYRDFIPPGCLI